MKTVITIIFVVLSFLTSFGQDLKVSILKGSDEPNTATEHFYLIEVSNLRNKASSFSISATNKKCNKEKSVHTDFSYEILNSRKGRLAEQLKVESDGSVEVLLKMTRPKNSKLNSWNCTEIMATKLDGKPTSNAIIIETFIPDPKDFN